MSAPIKSHACSQQLFLYRSCLSSVIIAVTFFAPLKISGWTQSQELKCDAERHSEWPSLDDLYNWNVMQNLPYMN